MEDSLQDVLRHGLEKESIRTGNLDCPSNEDDK